MAAVTKKDQLVNKAALNAGDYYYCISGEIIFCFVPVTEKKNFFFTKFPIQAGYE